MIVVPGKTMIIPPGEDDSGSLTVVVGVAEVRGVLVELVVLRVLEVEDGLADDVLGLEEVVGTAEELEEDRTELTELVEALVLLELTRVLLLLDGRTLVETAPPDGVRYQLVSGSFRHSPTVTPFQPFSTIAS